MSLYNNDNFVTVTTKIGEETIGSKTTSIYDTQLFKNTGSVEIVNDILKVIKKNDQ